jgi:dTDP-4-dehydrorhamnose reductase
MRALVTGASGTVGRALAARLVASGHEVVPWDRSRVPVDRYQPMEDFVRAARVDVVYGLAIASQPTGRENEAWLVNYEWPSELAWICRVLDVRYVHTSSAMVFSDRAVGPFTRASVADAEHGYGREKRLAEVRVLAQNPASLVVRLGWQIGFEGGNVMVTALTEQMRERGEIRASTRWLPACSFLDDTAAALERLATVAERGLYMIDSNVRWTHFEIARALAEGAALDWRVVPDDDGFGKDQRMIDPRLEVPSLRARLPSLPAESPVA